MADFFVSGLRRKVFATTDEKEIQDDLDCDYYVEEKSRTVSLTASGIAKPKSISAWRICPMWRTRRSCTTSIRP